jgi:hypothetical protein
LSIFWPPRTVYANDNTAPEQIQPGIAGRHRKARSVHSYRAITAIATNSRSPAATALAIAISLGTNRQNRTRIIFDIGAHKNGARFALNSGIPTAKI